jgi:predicted site-specific integrase-resolvase
MNNLKDLQRCNIQNAKCVVILANKNTSNPNLEDHTNILSTFSVKNYVKRLTNQDIRVCLQILKPENKDLFYGNLEERMRVN